MCFILLVGTLKFILSKIKQKPQDTGKYVHTPDMMKIGSPIWDVISEWQSNVHIILRGSL